jgi:hypothetical protein
MLVSEILGLLPASLDWMVLFNLSAVINLTEDTTVRAMFFLPTDTKLNLYSHAILTSQGGFLAPCEGAALINPSTRSVWSREKTETSLHERFSNQVAMFSVDEADCLGIGEKSPFPPILLHLKISSEYAEAKALFEREPSQEHYELLQAVGVKFLGGHQEGLHYIAEFRNRLPVHIHAGILAHFSRTGNCNLFFLQHGHIDSQLKEGLIKASESRITWAKNLCFQRAAQLGHEACHQSMAMKCQPPLSVKSFPFGDLVPLGFILKALNAASDSSISTIRQELRSFLLNKRQDLLWSFHTDGLITSTDSVLILQGFNETESVEALEIFADDGGNYHPHEPHAYYPQLSSQDEQPRKMIVDHRNRHWCQPDYPTTCLVRALRKEAGLSTKTTNDYLAAGFESRSGLFFANPYMVDWALASALKEDESAAELKEKLIAEILASINSDYSFGLYDMAMSTAFAVLSLTALGYRNRTIRLAQLKLLDFIDSQDDLPEETPFYSTLLIDSKQISPNKLLKLSLSDRRKQIIQINNQYHGISYYDDSYKMMVTAVVALALAQKCYPNKNDTNSIRTQQKNSHPRYKCRSHSEYIAEFALPPYLSTALPLISQKMVSTS